MPSTKERPWTTLSPESVQESILLEIARRYRYNLDPTYFTRLRKTQLLREICLRCGIQLQCREYAFDTNEPIETDSPQATKRTKKSLKTPLRERLTTFEPEDVANCYPISKEVQHKVSMTFLLPDKLNEMTELFG